MNVTELIFSQNILYINRIICVQLYEQCTGEKRRCKQIFCSKFHINVESREKFIYAYMQKGACDGAVGWGSVPRASRTMALGLTRPLREMSTMNTSWEVNAAGAQGWHPYRLLVSTVSKSGSLNFLDPSGPLIGVHRDCFTFTFTYTNTLWAFIVLIFMGLRTSQKFFVHICCIEY
jgi:hypothetical protein